jgi:photosystem II stability/assembly factor-like uncharacterized protein
MRYFAPSLIALAGLALATPARAQWTQVNDIPTTELFSMFSNGDTMATAADTLVYLSTDAGQTWKPSTKPVAGVAAIEALLVRNGRLYAGTFGQGVFVSDDLGTSWSAFNQGLTGGFANTQLDIVDIRVRGDSLYAATAGSGVYVRGFAPASTWGPFGTQLEPNQASTVSSMAFGGSRLLVSAGANGWVFFNDPGDPDWTLSNLDNVGIHAGLQAFSAKWNGSGWVVGTNAGVFRSVAGEEPWTRTDVGFGPLSWTAFTTLGPRFYGAFVTLANAFIEASDDGGATWHDEEGFFGLFIRDLAVAGGNLYAARGDGLWRRPIGSVAVDGGPAPAPLRFALASSQPVGDRARLRFDMPRAGEASVEVFDVHGRRVGDRMAGSWSPGPHEISLDATSLAPGVYCAALTAGGTREIVRIVRVR